MTGYDVFPERTGPKPLLRPATATKTTLAPEPSYSATMFKVETVAL